MEFWKNTYWNRLVSKLLEKAFGVHFIDLGTHLRMVFVGNSSRIDEIKNALDADDIDEDLLNELDVKYGGVADIQYLLAMVVCPDQTDKIEDEIAYYYPHGRSGFLRAVVGQFFGMDLTHTSYGYKLCVRSNMPRPFQVLIDEWEGRVEDAKRASDLNTLQIIQDEIRHHPLSSLNELIGLSASIDMTLFLAMENQNA